MKPIRKPAPQPELDESDLALEPAPPTPTEPRELVELVGVAKRPKGYALVRLSVPADDPRLVVKRDRLPRVNAMEVAVLEHQSIFAMEGLHRGRGRR